MIGFTLDEWAIIGLSLRAAGLATLLLLPWGLGAGALLARYRGRGLWLIESAINLPLALPPVVLGFLLLELLHRESAIGGWLYGTLGVRVVLAFPGVVLASMAVAFPLMAQSIRLAIEGVDPRLEQAAASLGAGRWRVWRTVTLPLAWRGLAAGCLLAFVRGLGEFGATLIVAGNLAGRTRTLPLAIFTHLSNGRDAPAWRLAAASILLASAAIAAGHWLTRRRSA